MKQLNDYFTDFIYSRLQDSWLFLKKSANDLPESEFRTALLSDIRKGIFLSAELNLVAMQQVILNVVNNVREHNVTNRDLLESIDDLQIIFDELLCEGVVEWHELNLNPPFIPI